MNLTVNVPVNTVLEDLDQSLRTLLKRELKRNGFDHVKIAFDTPSNDWSSQLTNSAVNLFLYDLRESTSRRRTQWETLNTNGGRPRDIRPPMVLECSYAVTAWTQSVEDEHRLLSQVLTTLYSYPILPAEVLEGRLTNNTRIPLETKIGMAKTEGKADFWTAVHGTYKVSLDYVVIVPVETDSYRERGPEVRSRTLRAQIKEGKQPTTEEIHGLAGTISDNNGKPLEDAWLVLPKLNRMTTTDSEGKFRIEQIPIGRHSYHARSSEGEVTEGFLTIPGGNTDLIIGTKITVTKPSRSK